MNEIAGFVLTIISFIINLLAVIISGYIVICLIRHEWRLRDVNLLLAINSYIPVFFDSIINVTWNIHGILGDLRSSPSSDSTACQVWGYIYLYVIIWLFVSFSIQAYIRMLDILNPNRTYIRSFVVTMKLVSLTYFVILLLLIPAIFLNGIVYQPRENQCTVDLHAWKGNLYMALVIYSIPIIITAITYVRVLRFIRESTLRNVQYRQVKLTRDVMVFKRIVILVSVLIVLGIPSMILWTGSLILGYLHPLTYRIPALFIAISVLILAVAVGLTNPQVKRLVPLLKN